MGVQVKHSKYNKMAELWKKCRVTAGGEEEVKDCGALYLPMLSGQDETAYGSYKMRALFFGAMGRTVEGLHGAVFRKPYTLSDDSVETAKALKYITADRRSLEDLSNDVVDELLITGRIGLLVDAPKTEGSPYVSMYGAEAIVNWRTEESAEGHRLVLVVLQETELRVDPKDEFSEKEVKIFRVLKMKGRVYMQEIWEKAEGAKAAQGKEYIKTAEITPKRVGRPLDYIPFQFINARDNSFNITKPPLLAMANVNLSHYRTSADLEHGRHFCGLPTAWVAGFAEDSILTIGSSVAWVSPDPQANAGFLEFTGQGLQSLENASEEKKAMMAVLGARMLEEPKQAVEAADTHKTRKLGESNALANLANSASSGLSTVLAWWNEWRGKKGELTVELNTDFVDIRLSPEEITALMSAYQGGGMSWDTLFFNFKRGEMYPDDATPEDEKAKIETEMPGLGGSTKPPKEGGGSLPAEGDGEGGGSGGEDDDE